MVPRRLDGSGVEAGVERNGTRTEGGVYHTTRPLFAVVVRVFRPRASVPIRASGDGKDGSDPPTFYRWRGSANGGVWHPVYRRVYHPPHSLRGGRSRPHVSLREGSPARTRAGRRAATTGPMRDRLLRVFSSSAA